MCVPRGGSPDGDASCPQSNRPKGADGNYLSTFTTDIPEGWEFMTPADYHANGANALLMAPFIPMLFMGEEWGTRAPFLYFTDHNPDLAKLVREGRRREFQKFAAFSDPARRETIPDPNAASTFTASVCAPTCRVRSSTAVSVTFTFTEGTSNVLKPISSNRTL